MAAQDVQDRKDTKSRPSQEGHGDNGQSRSAQGRHETDDDQGQEGGQHGWQSMKDEAPSLMRTYGLPAVVALVCGIAGAAGYWHFFGSTTSSAETSAARNEAKKAEAETTAARGKLHQAEAEWKAAMDELHQAQNEAHAARRSQEGTQMILDFLKKNLLSAGRQGDASLTAVFWTDDLGKDLSLHKAVDVAEGQVAASFGDRPEAEASVREMLGLAYLNLKEAPQAVKQYERALALREANQGVNEPDTASCRNQLAVAYRLAGRIAEASRLFDRNANSPTHATALFLRGSMLLHEHNPAEAELKLRACLTIRQKNEPENWVTFDTMSTLGEALLDQHKFADAEPFVVSGYEGMKQRESAIPEVDRPRLARGLQRILRLYEESGKEEKALRWRMELESSGAMKKAAP